jgi:hypothetical protein
VLALEVDFSFSCKRKFFFGAINGAQSAPYMIGGFLVTLRTPKKDRVLGRNLASAGSARPTLTLLNH